MTDTPGIHRASHARHRTVQINKRPECRYRVQSIHETLLKFGYKSPEVHFKCTVV